MKLHKVARFASTVKLVDPPCIFTAFNQLAELTGSVNLVTFDFTKGRWHSLI